MFKADKVIEADTKPTNLHVEALIKNGIPVKRAHFVKTVLSFAVDSAGIPEHALYAVGGSGAKYRLAVMYYTTQGLLVIQPHGTSLVPLANLSAVQI